MTVWEILGIEPTDDLKVIRRAFAAKSRTCHPEDAPKEFGVLQEAYRQAVQMVRSGNGAPETAVHTEPETPERGPLSDAAAHEMDPAAVRRERLKEGELFTAAEKDSAAGESRMAILRALIAELPDRLDEHSFHQFIGQRLIQIYLDDAGMRAQIDEALAARRLKGNVAQLRMMHETAADQQLPLLDERIRKGTRLRLTAAFIIMAAVFLLCLAVTAEEYL